MHRIVTILAATVALVAPAALPAAADATASCSLAIANAPVVSSRITTSTGKGQCNVGFTAYADLQYESGGTWHIALKGGVPVASQPDGPYPADTVENLAYSWSGLDETPCLYNWRVKITFVRTSTGGSLGSDTSPSTPKSC